MHSLNVIKWGKPCKYKFALNSIFTILALARFFLSTVVIILQRGGSMRLNVSTRLTSLVLISALRLLQKQYSLCISHVLLRCFLLSGVPGRQKYCDVTIGGSRRVHEPAARFIVDNWLQHIAFSPKHGRDVSKFTVFVVRYVSIYKHHSLKSLNNYATDSILLSIRLHPMQLCSAVARLESYNHTSYETDAAKSHHFVTACVTRRWLEFCALLKAMLFRRAHESETLSQFRLREHKCTYLLTYWPLILLAMPHGRAVWILAWQQCPEHNNDDCL